MPSCSALVYTWIICVALCAVGCVNVDPQTNEMIPRGEQRYAFEEVQENADRLQEGMTKFDVLLLLGSPAEHEDREQTWIYLPERAAVLIPGRSLKLQFHNGRLAEWGYHAIILGQDL